MVVHRMSAPRRGLSPYSSYLLHVLEAKQVSHTNAQQEQGQQHTTRRHTHTHELRTSYGATTLSLVQCLGRRGGELPRGPPDVGAAVRRRRRLPRGHARCDAKRRGHIGTASPGSRYGALAFTRYCRHQYCPVYNIQGGFSG